MIPLFGRSAPELSNIFNIMLTVVYEKHHTKLESVSHAWVDHSKFAQIVLQKGATLRSIWGFIDGTLKPVCRPSTGQRELYSGHKCRHGLKYQHITCPNGLVCHCFGLFIRWRHDLSMLADSNVEAQLQAVTGVQGEQFAVYSDGGYAP